jgi:hypothetical protein
MQILGPRSLNRSLNRNLLGKGLFDAASLDLRFAVNKTLDPRITFTRASTGTYVGGDGTLRSAATNEARFDHNPTTGESLGLLVEEARTNLVLRSEEFGTTWTTSNLTVTSNSETAPSGVLTADTLVEDSSLSAHALQQSANVVSGTAYTLSCYAKPAGRNFAQLLMLGGFAANITAIFDITTGAVGTTAGSPTVTSTNVGNGWYRLSITATATSTTSTAVQLRPSSSSSTAFYQGNGTSGIYLWGAQLEAGSFPTSYIPTTTATATRAADVASITGTAFSSFYNQTEGSVFANYRCFANTAYPDVFNISDGTNANRQQQFIDGSNGFTTFREIVSSTQQGITSQASTINSEIKSVGAYSSIGLVLTLNGLNPSTNANATHPTGLNKLSIGSSGVGITNYINGTLKRLTYWPVRLANPTLQAITQP